MNPEPRPEPRLEPRPDPRAVTHPGRCPEPCPRTPSRALFIFRARRYAAHERPHSPHHAVSAKHRAPPQQSEAHGGAAERQLPTPRVLARG